MPQTETWTLAIKPDWDAKKWNPGESDEKEEEGLMVIDSGDDRAPYADRPLIQRKAESTAKAMPTSSTSPVQETFRMKEYTPSELFHTEANSQ